jgi:hypothetical protein
MMKAMFAKDIRAKDVVLLQKTFTFRASQVHLSDTIHATVATAEITKFWRPVRIILEGTPISVLYLDSEDVLVVVHRPWPQGATSGSMRYHIRRLASLAVYILSCDVVDSLREAIDVYELGKSLDSDEEAASGSQGGSKAR